MTPFRFTILHLSQIRRTEALTFIYLLSAAQTIGRNAPHGKWFEEISLAKGLSSFLELGPLPSLFYFAR